MDVVGGDHLARGCVGARRRPAGRLPALPRDAVGEGGDHHDDEVDDAKREERAGGTRVARSDHIDTFLQRHRRGGELLGAGDDDLDHLAVDLGEALAALGDELDGAFRAEVGRCLIEQAEQILLDRRCDHRATAEAHDGHAGRHAAPIREPANERRDWRDVAKAEPAAANDAIAQIDQPQLVGHDSEAADDEAAAPAHCRDDANHAGTDFLKPLSGERRGKAKEDNRDGKDPHHR